MAPSHNLSGTEEYVTPATARVGHPHLFLVFDCSQPFAPSRRYLLRGTRLVTFGRGERLRSYATEDPASLRIDLADSWASTRHAQLRQVMGRWILEDLGSKNGTRLNGAPVKSSALADGDVLEVGHNFFVFRRELKVAGDSPAELRADELCPPHLGLATLNPELALQLSALVPVASSMVSVVIQGETGTGKELVARAVHELSNRKGACVPVNCGAIPETLLEAELFGYQKGAFSGAVQNHVGLIRSADEGTLFLDEIGDLPPAPQVSLLRVLQDRRVMPLGMGRSIPVDVRICSASHQNLERLVSQQLFREDLFGRISGFSITLPSLRQRREDLGLIISTLLQRASARRTVVFERRAARAILLYQWPRNIRELEKCLEAALALADNGPIAVEHLPASIRGSGEAAEVATPASGKQSDDDAQREKLVELLVEHDGNVSAVARALGKARVQVRRWLARHVIDPNQYRKRKASSDS